MRRVNLLCISLSFALCSCSGDGNRPPVLVPARLSGTEDEIIEGKLIAIDPEGGPLSFTLLSAPLHGHVEIGSTGGFTYRPQQNFNGEDRFYYTVKDDQGTSRWAVAELDLAPQNDPPQLALSDQSNSRNSTEIVVDLPVKDVDRDLIDYRAQSSAPDVVQAVVRGSSNELVLTPQRAGRAIVSVTATDGVSVAEDSFNVDIRDFVSTTSIYVSPKDRSAIAIRNISNESVTFKLEHNGFPTFRSLKEVADFVAASPEEFVGEPFERKLWRFVRDNVYHSPAVSAERWLYDPWSTLSSFGWGFCGHVAATYVAIARAAGYRARIWGLTGHVIPEIKIDDRWEMYDPDLAVYYLGADDSVTGAEKLFADPELITKPVGPVLPNSGDNIAYSQYIATIYGTKENNFSGEVTFMTPAAEDFSDITLPPRAKLVYPGQWAREVTGYDGDVPSPVPYYLQASIFLPSGSRGNVVVPWVLWEIRGVGRVRVDGVEYDVGSADLNTLLQRSAKPVRQVEVLDAGSDLQFVMFINAVRYGLKAENLVRTIGPAIVSLETSATVLSEGQRQAESIPPPLLKPKAILNGT